MIERRNFPSKRMVTPAKGIGSFQRKDVRRLFDDAEQVGRARRIRTYLAQFVSRKKTAQFARPNRPARVRDSVRNLLRPIVPCPYHPERNPLRRARADSRHLS